MLDEGNKNARARKLARGRREDVADHAAIMEPLRESLFALVKPDSEFPCSNGEGSARGKTELIRQYKDHSNVSWSQFTPDMHQGRFAAGWLACLLLQRSRAIRRADSGQRGGWNISRSVETKAAVDGRRSLKAADNPMANAVAIVHYLGKLSKDGESYLAKVMASMSAPPVMNRRTVGIIPKPFAVETKARMVILPATLPETTGPSPPMTLALPGMPEREIAQPALIVALFDAAVRRDGAVGVGGRVAQRLFIEFLLSVPAEYRGQGPVPIGPISIRELVVDWLQWDPANYGPNAQRTGQVLQRAMHLIRTFIVPWGKHRGFYSPLMVGSVSGWRLKDQITMIAQIPEGGDIGPPVDRSVLRYLGSGARASGPKKVGAFAAWRMYLALAFVWDRYGGSVMPKAPVGARYRQIRPTRPEVLRNGSGHVLGADGKPLATTNGGAVLSPYDPRAVPTGKREPNPSRDRYPAFNADDLVAMAFPRRERTNAWKWRQLAMEAAELLESTGACVIERMGHSKGKLPWRIMPPDGGS